MTPGEADCARYLRCRRAESLCSVDATPETAIGSVSITTERYLEQREEATGTSRHATSCERDSGSASDNRQGRAFPVPYM